MWIMHYKGKTVQTDNESIPLDLKDIYQDYRDVSMDYVTMSLIIADIVCHFAMAFTFPWKQWEVILHC